MDDLAAGMHGPFGLVRAGVRVAAGLEREDVAARGAKLVEEVSLMAETPLEEDVRVWPGELLDRGLAALDSGVEPGAILAPEEVV